jgi:hypothetical protein
LAEVPAVSANKQIYIESPGTYTRACMIVRKRAVEVMDTDEEQA